MSISQFSIIYLRIYAISGLKFLCSLPTSAKLTELYVIINLQALDRSEKIENSSGPSFKV